jgi:hypothetical protein
MQLQLGGRCCRHGLTVLPHETPRSLDAQLLLAMLNDEVRMLVVLQESLDAATA